MAYQSINPNDGQLLKSFEQFDSAQLEHALATAEQCYQSWKHKTYAQRAQVLNNAAALLQAHTDSFAKLATLEMGKRINEARGEVKYSGAILAYYAQHAETFLGPVKLQPRVGEAHMESSPIGVLFCVEPWNFPYYQLAPRGGAAVDGRQCAGRQARRQCAAMRHRIRKIAAGRRRAGGRLHQPADIARPKQPGD